MLAGCMATPRNTNVVSIENPHNTPSHAGGFPDQNLNRHVDQSCRHLLAPMNETVPTNAPTFHWNHPRRKAGSCITGSTVSVATEVPDKQR